ncbi:hypothetical protein QE177_14575 (plasmid) [Arsenophonus sp. aPb]|uniref:hypothetical protein n=1 Tax=Arsenophonus sp. aPb TaxID=3041619 RepID=UPI00246840B1|nr:hypothetical protein [Arsenophonus sp. aPb]WGL99806.1 hypothetical protein QE177_14575 [Arsenophonus sp. aPb]
MEIFYKITQNILQNVFNILNFIIVISTLISPISIASTITPDICNNSEIMDIGYRNITPANIPAKDGSGVWSTIVGCAASGEGKGGVTTLGTSSRGLDNHGVSVGFNSLSGAQSTSVGTGADAQNKSAIAIGTASIVTGNHGVAIGSNVKREIINVKSLSSDNLHAVDKRLESAATGGVAIGSNTDGGARVERGADNSVALGANSKASAAKAVALGANSLADKENTISVGSIGAERNITNVKAATLSASSTEAVNGSQLYGTNKSVVDSLGGGSSLNSDSTISSPKYNTRGMPLITWVMH